MAVVKRSAHMFAVWPARGAKRMKRMSRGTAAASNWHYR
jgi:hypothetical protein